MSIQDLLRSSVPSIRHMGRIRFKGGAGHRLNELRLESWSLHCFAPEIEPWYTVEGEPVSIPTGGFMLLPPGWRWQRGVHGSVPDSWRAWIYFDWPALDRQRLTEPCIGQPPDPRRLRQMLWRLNDRYHLGDDRERVCLSGLLIELLCELLLPPQAEQALDDHHRMLRQLEDLAHMPMDCCPPLEEALGDAGVSYDHRVRQFREWYGENPRDYLMRRRMERAADLLRETADSIASIAEQLGYHDISYFGRCFRRIWGKSPASWRRLHM